MKKIKTIGSYLLAIIFLLIGILSIAFEEPWFGIGFILLSLMMIPILSRLSLKLFTRKNRLFSALAIALAIFICMATFGRKEYYDKEPKFTAVAPTLGKHKIYQTKLDNGMKYAYLEKGSGPTIILLHGFPDMASTWDQTIDSLSKDYHVIAPFLRGYYPTDIPKDEDYSVRTIAEDIIQLMDKLEVDRFTVVGQDWGASVAQTVTNLAEKRVNKVVSIAIPHPTCLDPSLELIIAGRHFFMFGSGDYGVRYARKNEFDYIERLYQRWSPDYTNYKESSYPIIETFKYPNRLEAATGYYRSFANETEANNKLYNRIPNVPIYFMVGKNDLIYQPDIINKMKKTMPEGSKTTVFNNAGHFLHHEVFSEYIVELRKFIEGAP